MNYIVNSLIISLLFTIFKFIHLKYILKETIIPKNIIIDALFVFIASIITIYSIEKFNLDNLSYANKTVQAFINKPDF